MPELPEVEVTLRGIAPSITGQVVSEVAVRERHLRWPVPDAITQLAGQRVRSIQRRGKYLLFNFDSGQLIVHLGMSGSLRLVPSATPAGKHDHVDVCFKNLVLRLRDPRRFGAVLWAVRGDPMHPLLAHLGIEPLSPDLTGVRLHSLAGKHRTSIKQFLMDGRRIVGIGNIYANESLFRAGICPLARADRVSLARCERLAAAIRQTLRAAIRAGGSTLRDFVGGDGKPGYFQQTYSVYDRADQDCHVCGTPIRRLVQGQRATFYCPRCQR